MRGLRKNLCTLHRKTALTWKHICNAQGKWSYLNTVIKQLSHKHCSTVSFVPGVVGLYMNNSYESFLFIYFILPSNFIKEYYHSKPKKTSSSSSFPMPPSSHIIASLQDLASSTPDFSKTTMLLSLFRFSRSQDGLSLKYGILFPN